MDREAFMSLGTREMFEKLVEMGDRTVESYREKIGAVDARLQELQRGAPPKYVGEREGLLKLRECFLEKARKLIVDHRQMLERQQQRNPGGITPLLKELTAHHIRALEELLDETSESRIAAAATGDATLCL
jgi:hypothetical protein